jgi:tetratricopeptide (TPR) repeat protein
MTQTAARNIFLISDSLGWYIQGLLATCENYYSLRQFERIEGVVDILENLPLTKAQQESVLCYRALVYNWRKLFEKAKSILEPIADNSGRALYLLGTLNFNSLKLDEARRYYREAAELSPQLTLEAFRNIAIIESIDGNHKGSLRELERLLPLALSVRASQPTLCLDHYNSLAVELCEAGRIQEAGVVSRIVLASPYAFAYPEWRETGNDIALKGYKSRSAVPVIHSFVDSNNLVRLPVPGHRSRPIPTKRGKVLSYKDWKEKKAKESISEEFDRMSDKDLVIKIFELAAEDGMTWRKLRRVVDYIIKVHSEPY